MKKAPGIVSTYPVFYLHSNIFRNILYPEIYTEIFWKKKKCYFFFFRKSILFMYETKYTLPADSLRQL